MSELTPEEVQTQQAARAASNRFLDALSSDLVPEGQFVQGSEG